ncbi:unnamed protein product [Taenia asiatica]|uniref:Septin-type G domain-containing protein n=1 Tax=Taenia asiatica TaxID=60517 RepID=A0A0R3W459_TAEAS|nr:unnamed protein product [Taenia asiatica]
MLSFSSSTQVNLIPIIAKADTMTVEECRLFKTAVQSQLLREDIHTYDFPLSAIPETYSVGSSTSDSRIAEVKRLRLRQPFAVCTSSHVITKEDGSKVDEEFRTTTLESLIEGSKKTSAEELKDMVFSGCHDCSFALATTVVQQGEKKGI